MTRHPLAAPRRSLVSLAALVGLTVSPLLAATPARAQEEPPPRADDRDAQRTDEVAELEALLARVSAALARLRPVVETRLVQYDVRHLLWRPTDRPAPPLSIPSLEGGTRTAAGGSFSFDDAEEVERTGLEPDRLEALVVSTVGGDAWDDPASIELHRGYLLIRQTEAAHARIARLLQTLKRSATRAVQLEVQFYALSPALAAELERSAAAGDGVLAPSALARLDQAVALEPQRLTGTALLTALDRQRIFLHQGAERAYVSDYERSSGGTGQVVEQVDDPIVETLVTGLALDVRPTILDGARRRVALDVRFTRTGAAELIQRQTPWGPLDVPRLASESVRTSARVPPGSGMLVFSSRTDGEQDVTIVVRPRIVGP